jgi:hypothetical protein
MQILMSQMNNKAGCIKETNRFLALLWAVNDQSGIHSLSTHLRLNNALQLRVIFSELN